MKNTQPSLKAVDDNESNSNLDLLAHRLLPSLLIVDDSEDNRNLLAHHLEFQGYTITAVEDGSQALEILKTQSFDLVLLDIMMPKMNGYQVLQHMKEDNHMRHIPVIIISAVEEMDSVVKCIKMGAEDYMLKPFKRVLLNARIGACLEKKRLRDQELSYMQLIEKERKRSDDLLHIIFPDSIVNELKVTKKVRPRRYENVAVLFCDIVGFTSYCDRHQPEEVLSHLQEMVVAFEDLAHGYGLQKIKTIGDSFMATVGLLKRVENPVLNSVICGLEMLSTVRRLSAGWDARIGIHVGSVIAGVVGRRQYLFDVWGDTVNTAARVESHGLAGAVNVSSEAWQQVSDRYKGKSLGKVPVKGKGKMEIFHLK